MKRRQGRPGLAERRRTASAKRRVLVGFGRSPRKCTASDSCHCVDEILEARNQLTVRGIRVPHELLGGDLGGGEHRSTSPYELGQIRADVLEEQLEAGRVVSGASTLTMQTVRIARHNPARTLPEKFWEMLLALRLEAALSKDEILAAYAAHAPFARSRTWPI